MTDYTPILHLPQVASNQEQKEATINTAISILEAAMNDTLAVSLAAGNVTLNGDQFTKYFLHQYAGHSVARVVTIPATRRWFAVQNGGTAPLTLKIAGSAGLSAELPSGKIGLLVSDGVDLRFVVPDAADGMGLLADLSDVSGVPTNNQLLRYTDAGKWAPWSLQLGFRQLSDAPIESYGSAAGMLLGVNASGTALEWQTSSANVNSFVDLDDAPNSYAGAAGRYVRVNTAGTGLIFATPSLLHNSDFPSNFAVADVGKFLQVAERPSAQGGGRHVVFNKPTLADLSDGPGQPTIDDALLFVRVNAAGTGLEFVTGTGGPVNFVELQDTPSSFTGQKGKLVRVNTDETQLVFETLRLTELSDTPKSLTGAAGKLLRVNGAQSGFVLADLNLKDLADAPDTYVAGRYLRINAANNGLEYVKPALTELGGFPADFAGQGGKFLQVRPDEQGVRFTNSAVSVDFLGLTDTPDDYSNAQNKFIRVDASGSGLIFSDLPTIATKLDDLTDVDVTDAPSAGQVLMFSNGQWRNETLTVGAAALAGLTDVDLATTAPQDGQSLVFRDGKWVPETVEGGAGGGGATALDELTDVDLTAGPFAGAQLAYVNGQWTATTPGVPSSGAHRHWRLFVASVASGTQVGIQDLWFRRTRAGAQLATGGTATASSQSSTATAPTYAFDNSASNWLTANNNVVNAWIAYDFGQPVEVRYLELKAPQDQPNRAPRDFAVQWSDDGLSWTTAWNVAGQTGWAASELRQFHPASSLFFTDLADTPQSLIGHALKAVRVRADSLGLEFYSPPAPGASSLDGLTDVDLTDPPEVGQVLTYSQSGYWLPASVQTDKSLADLTDVDFTDAPDQDDMLWFRDGKWTAAPAPTVSIPEIALDELSDVTAPLPLEGQALAYRGGQWQAVDAPTGYGAHAYWRIKVLDTDAYPGSTSVIIDEVFLRAVRGGAQAATGGSPVGSGGSINAAFSGTADVWSGVLPDAWIGYHFNTPVVLAEVALRASSNAVIAGVNTPTSFVVQFSDDGLAWFDAWSVSGVAPAWAPSQVRAFSDAAAGRLDDLVDVDLTEAPVSGEVLTFSGGVWQASAPALQTFLQAPDTPNSYAGSEQFLVAVKADGTGLEFVSASTLNDLYLQDLLDVEGTSEANIGDVLTYLPGGDDEPGVWRPGPLSVALSDLLDVSILNPAPTDGQVLVYVQSFTEGVPGHWEAQTLDTDGGGGSDLDLGGKAIEYGQGAPENPPFAENSSLYLRDDEGRIYIATGGVASPGLTVVQTKVGYGSSSPPNVVLDQAPTEGNTLVAMLMSDGPVGMHADWSTLDTTTGDRFNQCVAYLDVPAGMSTSVPLVGGGAGVELYTVFEIAGAPDFASSVWAVELFPDPPTGEAQAASFEPLPYTAAVDDTFGLAMVGQITSTNGGAAPTLAAPFTSLGAYQNASASRQATAGRTDLVNADDDLTLSATLAGTAVRHGAIKLYLLNGSPTEVAATEWRELLQEGDVGLDRLNDVDLSTAPTDGQVLAYDEASGQWSASSATGGSTLATLTDVDLSTPPADGQALVWNEALEKWAPGASGSEEVAGVPYGAHRYWRLNCTNNGGATNNAALRVGELRVFGVSGAPIATAGGTAYGSSIAAGYSYANAFDGNPATVYRSGPIPTTAAPQHVGYHFPTPVEVASVRVSVTENLLGGPIDFSIDYSDDGATWTTAWNVVGAGPWADKVEQTFVSPDLVAPVYQPHSYWRLYITANNGEASYTVVDGLEMRGVSGGPTLCVGGTAFASSESSGATSAANAFTPASGYPADTAYWTTAAGEEVPCWIGYQFASPVAVREIVLAGTRDAARCPRDFTVEWSDDGSTWTADTTIAGQTAWKIDGTDKRAFEVGATNIVPIGLGALPDVKIASDVQDGDILVRAGGYWETQTPPEQPRARGTFSAGLTYTYGDTVTYNGVTYLCLETGSAETPGMGADWQALINEGATSLRLGDLSDVVAPEPATGDVLVYGTTGWVAQASDADLVTVVDDASNAVTLSLADRQGFRSLTAASPVVVTVPPHSVVAFPIGTSVSLRRAGEGVVSISPAGGVTLLYPDDVNPVLRKVNSVGSLVKLADNIWSLFGDLEAAT